MAFNLKDYEEVKDRLPRFLGDPALERPRVVTRLITNPDNLAVEACFVAELWDADTLLATGHAFELRTDSGKREVNATSWIENSETSAIGRALANAGYASGKNRPSREEMEKAERMRADADSMAGLKATFTKMMKAADKNGALDAVKHELGDPADADEALAAYAAMSDEQRALVALVADGAKEES